MLLGLRLHNFQILKSDPKTMFKRAKITLLQLGSFQLGGCLARLLVIRNLLDFLNFDCF